MVFVFLVGILVGLAIGVAFKNAERDKDTKRLDLFEANVWHAIMILNKYGHYNWFPSDERLRNIIDELEKKDKLKYKTWEQAHDQKEKS